MAKVISSSVTNRISFKGITGNTGTSKFAERRKSAKKNLIMINFAYDHEFLWFVSPHVWAEYSNFLAKYEFFGCENQSTLNRVKFLNNVVFNITSYFGIKNFCLAPSGPPKVIAVIWKTQERLTKNVFCINRHLDN